MANSIDCVIKTVATEEQNLRWLKECSEGSGSSMRELVARRQYKEKITINKLMNEWKELTNEGPEEDRS